MAKYKTTENIALISTLSSKLTCIMDIIVSTGASRHNTQNMKGRLDNIAIWGSELTEQQAVADPGFPRGGGRQLFTVSTYERHVTSLHNQQAKTSHVIFM